MAQAKPVQILFLDHTAVLSGAELSMLNLVQRLDGTRYAPTVLLFADGPLVKALREAGVAVEILPLADAVRGAGRGSLGVGSLARLGAIFTSAAFVLRLARTIRAAKPDIVHCNCLKSDILGGFAARLAGVKIIWHIHDRIETDYLPAAVVKVFRFLLRHIPHYVIANSQGTLETLKLPAGKRWAVVYPSVPAVAAAAAKNPESRTLHSEGNEDAAPIESAALPDNSRFEVLDSNSSHDGATEITENTEGDAGEDPQITQISQINDGGGFTTEVGEAAEVSGLAGQPAGRGPAEVGPIESAALPNNLVIDHCSLDIEKASSSVVSSCLGGEPNSVVSVPSVARPPVVVLVGRISPWKGQDVFIRAAAMVLKQFPACRFQIVGSALFGEDALEGELKQLAETLGVADRVEFLGFRKDVPEIIAGSTLLVHASTVPEPFGQVIVQAMAEGKPVVATRGGGVLEIVEDGKTGKLVPMKDVEAMAKGIGEILSDPVRAQKMGEAGRERFLERFTIEKTVEAVEGIYGSMTDDR